MYGLEPIIRAKGLLNRLRPGENGSIRRGWASHFQPFVREHCSTVTWNTCIEATKLLFLDSRPYRTPDFSSERAEVRA